MKDVRLLFLYKLMVIMVIMVLFSTSKSMVITVLFSTSKSMVIMGSCVRFCLHNMLFLISLVNAPEFRCCRVISLANQKLTFDEIISTRHDDFSPKSDRTVSL